MRSVNKEEEKICLFLVVVFVVTLLIVNEISEEIRGLRIFVWRLIRLFLTNRSRRKFVRLCERGRVKSIQ